MEETIGERECRKLVEGLYSNIASAHLPLWHDPLLHYINPSNIPKIHVWSLRCGCITVFSLDCLQMREIAMTVVCNEVE